MEVDWNFDYGSCDGLVVASVSYVLKGDQMIYDDEKTKEMARSVLPSKRRDTVKKERQSISRAARRASKQILHTADFEEDDGLDEIEMSREHEIYQMSNWRKASKGNHLRRWAKKIVKDIPPEDRATFVKAKLPDNYAGDLAFNAIKWIDEFPSNPSDYRRSYDNYKVKTPPMSLEVFLKKIESDDRMVKLLNEQFLDAKVLLTFYIFTKNIERKVFKETILNKDNKYFHVYETRIYNEKVNHCFNFPGLQFVTASQFLNGLNELLVISKDRKLVPKINETKIAEMIEKENPHLRGNLVPEDRNHTLDVGYKALGAFNTFASMYFDCHGDWHELRKNKNRPNEWRLGWKFKELC
jgi:hypothetical protein